MPYSVVIAGSTERSRICASALFADERFTLTGIITPTPKPVGRKQIVEPNPLHSFAVAHEKPLVIVENKLDDEFRARLERVIQQPDILLVVDFGYIIRPWLLSWPTIAPINVHPSDLPKYRGSSPGQFALAFGEKNSAVAIMQMDEQMDHGPLIGKLPFAIAPEWKAADYYEHAFGLVREQLSEVIHSFIQTKESTPQPDVSPTPIARMLKRDDGYIPYEAIQELLERGESAHPIPFAQSYGLPTSAKQVYNLFRAFHPWPGLWTLMPLAGQMKRVKLLSVRFEHDKLFLDRVQVEGKTEQPFSTLLFEKN